MAVCSYDPLQLAQRQSADFAALRRQDDPAEQARTALKCLEWIEYAEESMIKAENDCLVEYSEEMHHKLHDLYVGWLRQFDDVLRVGMLAAMGGERDSSVTAALADGERRVRQRLQAQADIERHTLSHAELSAMARAANLSDGNRSPHATPR
jgi:hypothetical protein